MGGKPNPKPNPIGFGAPNPKIVGKKSSPNPQDPKPVDIRPETAPLPSLGEASVALAYQKCKPPTTILVDIVSIHIIAMSLH